jgi:uncharacterized membrane protein YdbT with pleckstrin-like domain
LKIEDVGRIDTASHEVKAREIREEEEARLNELNKKDKRRIKKMRGKNKAGHVQESKTRQQHEVIREKNKIVML